MKEDILKVINNYGIMPQLKYFQSEVFELNEAIIRHDQECYQPDDANEHIAEEIADVMFMLKQFQYCYEIDDSTIEEIMKFKIDRQLKRIEDNGDE